LYEKQKLTKDQILKILKILKKKK